MRAFFKRWWGPMSLLLGFALSLMGAENQTIGRLLLAGGAIWTFLELRRQDGIRALARPQRLAAEAGSVLLLAAVWWVICFRVFPTGEQSRFEQIAELAAEKAASKTIARIPKPEPPPAVRESPLVTAPPVTAPPATAPIPAPAPPPEERRDPEPTKSAPANAPTTTATSDRLEKLLEEQNRIAAAKLQPRFRFVLKDCRVNLPAGAPEGECLEVWNDGERVQDFSIRQMSFLEIQRYDLSPGEWRFVPFYYFWERRNTDDMQGLLATLGAYEGLMAGRAFNPRYSTLALDHLMTEIKKEFGSSTTSVARRLFLQIFYTDLAGNYHTVDIDAEPQPDFFGSRGVAAPFKLNHALQWTQFTPSIFGLTAKIIRERWQSYPTHAQLSTGQK